MLCAMSGFLREQCFVDGRWREHAGNRIDVVNPATGACIASVANAGADVTNEAIDAARRALPAWRGLTPRERATFLRRIQALLVEHAEALAQLLTAEQGKSIREARGEVAYAASFVDWYAAEAERVYGETVPARKPDRRLIVQREPIGVCAAITPWNFPSAMIARKLAPALAAGCTFVVKPAESTPLSGLAWGKLCELAELPAGVVNIVTGDPAPIGKAMMDSPVVRKLSFTGSTAVGKLLIRQSADTVKKLSLELGGNAPFVVFADADMDRAIDGAIASKFRNSGQTCVCANRFLVHREVAAEFAGRLAKRAGALTVGDGSDEATDLGPMINRAAVDKVLALYQDAVEQGAEVVYGEEPAADGLYCTPVVLRGVTPSMKIFQGEIFGPVASITEFDTEAEAIALANDTRAGLACYLYTSDVGRMFRVAEALEYGMVGINEGMISSAQIPFGGVKESGIGREGGHQGIDEYLQLKYLCLHVDQG